MDLWAEGRQRWSDRDLMIASALPAADVMARIRGGQTGHATHRVEARIDHAFEVRGYAGHDWFRIYARRRLLNTGMTRLATGTVHTAPEGGSTLHATFWITQFRRAAMARALLAATVVAVVLFVAEELVPELAVLLYGWLGLMAAGVVGVLLADRAARKAELMLEHWLRFCADEVEAAAHIR